MIKLPPDVEQHLFRPQGELEQHDADAAAERGAVPADAAEDEGL